MTGWVAVVIGLLLCFAGMASLHLAVLLSGFGLAWMLADAFGASGATTLVIAAAGALAAWVLVSLVFRTALFFVGAIVGAAIGAKLYGVLQQGDGSVVVAVVFVLAVAFACGYLANRWRARVLLWLTALGGSALALSGIGRAWDGSLRALADPETQSQAAVSILVWFALAGFGWWVQRRVSARSLEES